ncbi:tyrosine-type recombinase/integrase [Methylotenera sp. N17]|uniref:tyrosine-type recombinase/integrase n=1 Tax=Methylotenera sp. N17 TaxID=1502761 RepID=UPI000646E326|nr:integrase arm-type DNA-binding domain-containing protein [Methylotenera sp. N17]
MALTDTAIRNAKPKDKPYKLFDEKGLFIQVTPNGGKWWRFKYKFEGKEKLLSLGTYPEVPLAGKWHDPDTKKIWIDGARDRRDKARELLACDIDPSDNRKAKKETKNGILANSLEVIAREWITTKMQTKSEGYRNNVLRRFELYLFPWLGKFVISEITAPELLDVVRRIENQNKVETAYRTLQATGQVFRYAVQTGRALRDVTSDLRGALIPSVTKHMPSLTEPQQVAELMRAIDGFTGTLTVQTALRLAPLVFVRPSELRKAKWVDIDLDAGEWRYFVTKTKTEHIVPLCTQAIKHLKTIQSFSGQGEFVFQGGHNPDKAMSEAAINAALRRMGYDTKTEITGHGFRAMARTILHERLNIDPHIIEHQLAHKVPDSLGNAYNRTKFLDQRKVMMQQWADYLDELKAGAKIVPFKKT